MKVKLMRSVEETGSIFPTSPHIFRALVLEVYAAQLLEPQLCCCVS